MDTLKHNGDEKYTINIGNSMANGLFNLSNAETEELSLWFDKEKADQLISLPENEFNEEAEELLNYAEGRQDHKDQMRAEAEEIEKDERN